MSKKEEPAMGVRTAPFTKPVKVPNWTKFLRLETYIKQIETQNNNVTEDVPTNKIRRFCGKYKNEQRD